MFTTGSAINKMNMQNNELYSLPDSAFDDVSMNQLDLDNNFLVVYPGNALADQNLVSV